LFSLDGQAKGWDQAEKQSQRYDDLELVNYLDQDSNRSSPLAKVFGLEKKAKFGEANFFGSTEDNDDEDEKVADSGASEYEGEDKLSSYFLNWPEGKLVLFVVYSCW
jgi:hypothetical protein